MSKLANRVSILAIGTELTTGQVTNRNAAWIAEKCVNLGAEVVLHETVADDHEAIANALDRCWSAARIVFVCGGLGPTTDDFTRDCISKWLKAPLEFYEPTWTKIETRLKTFGVPVSPSNKQQAYYPQGSQVLNNPHGTADGFSCTHLDGKLWVLPGPPREIEAIWDENRLDEKLRSALPQDIQPSELHTWSCMGVSEAQLGELTEKALEGSGFLTGYRAHRPYIEVKVWVPQNKKNEAASQISKLEAAIGKWVVAKNGDDLAEMLFNSLRGAESIDILEAGTAGTLSDRLGPLLRRPENRELAALVTHANEWLAPSDPAEWIKEVLLQAGDDTTLAIAGPSSIGEWHVGLQWGEKSYQDKISYGPTQLKPAAITGESFDRSRAYAIEAAFQRWLSWISSARN
jgi:nicotinamide-nucleotide amidase